MLFNDLKAHLNLLCSITKITKHYKELQKDLQEYNAITETQDFYRELHSTRRNQRINVLMLFPNNCLMYFQFQFNFQR